MSSKEKRNPYIRKEIYPIQEVLSKVIFSERKSCRAKSPENLCDFDGDLMNMTSLRYQLFALKGVNCVTCGIEGKFFAKEKFFNSKEDIYHFNLYAVTTTGKEILMTKDHILPSAKGGLDTMSNFQTMCTVCNCNKGCSIQT